MKRSYVISGAVLLGAAILAIGRPSTAAGVTNCTATQLVPALGEVQVTQGAPGAAKLARGKETLVKFFLTKPTACTMGSTQSLTITGASLDVNSAGQTSTGISAYQSFASPPAVSNATVAVNSQADPIFAVSGDKLAPGTTAEFTPSFTLHLTYTRKNGTTITTGQQVNYANTQATNAGASKVFDKQSRALRVLVVPMGDGTTGVAASTQYTDVDRTSTVNGLAALSRILPTPTGLDSLGASSPAGVRYVIDLATLINLKDPSVPASAYQNGKFCGSAVNWSAIKGLLERYLEAWNTALSPTGAPANPPADRALGVVGEGISSGYQAGCAEGMASLSARAGWVRAITDKPASGKTPPQPSMTGALMAMELQHTWGMEPSPRSGTTHSGSVGADTAQPDRSYNVVSRSWIQNDHSAMNFDTTVSPPWNNDNTFDEPPDFAFSLCVLGGTMPSPFAFGNPPVNECPNGADSPGTLMGTLAGPGLVASGTTDNTPGGTTVLWSQAVPGQTQLTAGDPSSLYRYVRRVSATNSTVENNIGFPVRFSGDSHGSNGGENFTSNVGQFGFALPDTIPPPSQDLARIELWKLNPNTDVTADPSETNGDTLLYARDQQTEGPTLGSITTTSATVADHYTSTPVNEANPALSNDGDWVAWEAPLAPAVPTSRVIHVAPRSSSASAVTLPVPLAGKRIAFVSNRDAGDLEIYSRNADGTGSEFRLTTSAGRDIMPAVSPDGTQIAFVSDRSDDDQIYVMSSFGGTPTQLTSDGANAFPAWSPDGSKIAFMSDRSGNREIWRMNADGTSQTAVTTAGDDYYPTWSPDGSKIAFASTRGGSTAQIWVANSNGTGSPTQLTTSGVGPAVHDQPAWSTEGSKIAFSGGSDGAGPFDVYVMNADGTDQTNLTAGNADDDRTARWSPDGTKIAFTSTRGANTDVYYMNADGSGVTRLTTNDASDTSPSWSPSRATGLTDADAAWKGSGDALAYDVGGDVYTQAVDTSGPTASVVGQPARVYDFDAGAEFGPPAADHATWSPTGTQIAFAGGDDLYVMNADGTSVTQLTSDVEGAEDLDSDPSWSRAGSNLISFTREAGCEVGCFLNPAIYTLDPASPAATQSAVTDDIGATQPSFGADGRIAFVDDGNVWSVKSDGTDAKQLTAGGGDKSPTLTGSGASARFAFVRTFTTTCSPFVLACFPFSQDDVMLAGIAASGQKTITWTASGPGNDNFVSALYLRCGGYAFPVDPYVLPSEVNGAVDVFNANFDTTNACGVGGGTLFFVVTNGVQTAGGGSGDPSTAANSSPKPPRAAILSPAEGLYPRNATFALNGNGYDADNAVLNGSQHLKWTVSAGYPGQEFTGNTVDLKPPTPSNLWPVGYLTFTLTVTDDSGQTGTATRTVQIGYDFVGGGFQPPTLNPPQVNSASAGGNWPVKWQLKNVDGTYIRDLSTVKSVQQQGPVPGCNFDNPDGTTVALPTGGTFLRYDTKNEQFVYNWALPMTKGCYLFRLTLTDETVHTAHFKLK